jgi:hypothetical protein
MTQTLLAEDYKIAPTRFREIPDRERVAADIGTHPVRRSREGELSSAPAAISQSGTSAATEARSRLSFFYGKLVEWLKGCAEAYAAAAAYENLSRLSDGELRRRGLSRDVLARDLMKVMK